MHRPFDPEADLNRKKVVFLDKDGTLVEDVPFNIDFSLVRFKPDLLDALKILQLAGYELFIVSNQSGVAKGLYSMDEVNAHFKKLLSEIADHGVHIKDFFICPHGPDKDGIARCSCRKPRNGMLLTAASRYMISLKDSWMLGDILDDVEAGNAAGCRSILLDTGSETIWDQRDGRKPEFIAHTLTEAAEYIRKNGSV
jgi:D-glycero-D-manno-heptose 1,7-bisphosphate phosphatase